MKPQEEKPYNNACFTDFDNKFHTRLSHVIPRQFAIAEESKFAGISARYEGRIKVEYQKDLMGLLEEGMVVACPSTSACGEVPSPAGPFLRLPVPGV